LKPYLKWPGGKARQQERIRSRFNSRAKLYVEPFLGAGAVFFARAAADEFDQAIIADVNPRLMACHQGVRDHVEQVIYWLGTFPNKRDPAEYYKLRNLYNGSIETGLPHYSLDEHAALFIWLNRACFNGLYRENTKGEFNTPVGKGPLSLPDPDHLRACSKLLQKAELMCIDFGDLLEAMSWWSMDDTHVYCDPPYVPLNPTSDFTSYSKGGFKRLEQGALSEYLGGLAGCGARVIASNSDTPLVRELYAGWDIEVVSERRAINATATKRGPVNELLISKNCNEARAAA
jgi:DNA adenine methylase